MGIAVADGSPAGDVRDVTLSSLGIRNFRNLARVDLDLPAEGVAVIGDNGHGKTNLLEAIAYLAVMRSVRGVRDRDLVRFGERAFSIAADAQMDGATLGAGVSRITVGFEVGSGAAGGAPHKRVSVDGVPVRRLSDAFGAVPSVVIAPRDVALVSGAPGERRRYLDVLLAMTDRRYLAALQRYRAALLRRNAALRHAAARSEAKRDGDVAAWEAALADAGSIIRAARVRWLREFAARIATLCQAIGERARVSVRYSARSDVPAEEGTEEALRGQLAHTLEHDRPRDLRRQLTHAGPHRDDLTITLGGHPIRIVGSAGQQRTVAIALRLAARDTIRDALGRLPITLLDDPFAELDVARTERILDLLYDRAARGAVGQLVIAVPRATELPSALTPLRRLTIRDGVVGL